MDTDTGIDLNTQQRLFQPFQQGDAESGGPQVGNGFGPVICSMLVRALGGEIDMASTSGKGTRMSFVQTRPASTTAQLATTVEAVWSMRSLRVRVVEANNINRKLLNIMREQLGHIAFAVADGETAISHCH